MQEKVLMSNFESHFSNCKIPASSSHQLFEDQLLLQRKAQQAFNLTSVTSYDLYYLLCLFLGRYSCTSQGTVYQIDYQKIMLDKVIRLLPIGSRNDPAKYGGTTLNEFGIRLNSLCVNDSFCATGSDDGFLRLWPLDFSTVFLEAGQ